MQVVEIREPGPPEVLVPAVRPVPAPATGEILIRVAAAGVNRPDCLQRRGLYPPPPGASDLPGLEVAGTVAATGTGVTGFKPGNRVCALLAGGGYAEYCTAPAVQCLPVPDGISLQQAAAIPEAFFTVWANLFERGALKAGETVLVHGGASGIGSTAIQLAVAFGATAFATAGNPEKKAFCEQLGAKRAIDYRQEDFAAVIDTETSGRGVDVILDIVGGKYLAANQKTLATGGRLAIVGVLGGAKAELNLARLLTGQQTITGSTLRARDTEEKGRIARALKEHVWPLLERGECLPVIQRSYPLTDAADAHRWLEANRVMGKIVLTVGD
ncbi:MAG TPA: NAD(P)H-quinone oxidoreductase [Chromatiales bacterium]|nr:NAD(P)H-quinone oxidoreductase [Chromatiales bacterium]